MSLQNLLGPNSYKSVCDHFAEFLQGREPDTFAGKQLFDEMYNSMQSQTPIRNLNKLVYEKSKLIEKDDVVSEFVKMFSRKVSTNYDFNFLLNIAAEDHYIATGVTADKVLADNAYLLNQTSDIIVGNLHVAELDMLNSVFVKKMKNYATQQGLFEAEGEPETDYKNVKDIIVSRLEKAEAATQEGSAFLNQVLVKLNESETPIIDTNKLMKSAETSKLTERDASVKQVLAKVKRDINSKDTLNYLLNLAAEEHLDNLHRANHPDAQSTLKEVRKHLKNNSETELERLIGEGAFAGLQSDLLERVRKINIAAQRNDTKPLNESVSNASVSYQNGMKVMKYNPIGFVRKTTNGVYALMEGQMFFVNKDKTLRPLNESEQVNLKANEKRLAEALETIEYDIDNMSFVLDIPDTDLERVYQYTIDSENNVMITIDGKRKEVEGEHLIPLLKEEIERLKGLKLPDADYNTIIDKCDCFATLYNNFDKLVDFNGVDVIISTDGYKQNKVILQKAFKDKMPNMLFESYSGKSHKFESYKQLNESVKSILGCPTKLFESELQAETQQQVDRQNKIEKTQAKIQELNEALKVKKELVSLAEDGSQAYEELTEEIEDIEDQLKIGFDYLESQKVN